MSDTEQDSISTLTQFNFEDLLQSLDDSARECLESKDFISFSTILDIHFHDLSLYSDDEKIRVLQKLHDILENNHELVYEIGWDLPAVLFNFMDSKWPPVLGLAQETNNVLILKMFEILFEYGNPKELILSCCGLIRDLKRDDPFSDEFVQSIENEREQFYYVELPLKNFVLKFHSLLQILLGCLRRNKTLYPSKFLSKVVTALIDFMNHNKGDATLAPITRRIYTFIRDYVPPDVPDNNCGLKINEVIEIVNDENYLQRKLLTLLLTVLVEKATLVGVAPLIQSIIPSLTPSRDGYIAYKEEFDVLKMVSTLSLSMDLQLDHLLSEKAIEAGKLFDNKTVKSGEDIFKYVIDDYNKELKEEQKHIPTSSLAITILYMFGKYLNEEHFKYTQFDVLDLIKLQIKTFVPFMINQSMIHYFTVGSTMILTMEALDKLSENLEKKKELSEPKNGIFVMTYLQNLTSLVFSSGIDTLVKFYYMLVTKLLICMDEQLIYHFLIDTIENCPFEQCKPTLIGILKDFILREKVIGSGITNDISKLKLNEPNNPANGVNKLPLDPTKLPPELPPRQKSIVKYITLTDSRSLHIMNLFDNTIDETFNSQDNNPTDINYETLNKLLSFINFVNSVRDLDKNVVLRRLNRLDTIIKNLQGNGDSGTDQDLIVLCNLLTFGVEKGQKLYSS